MTFDGISVRFRKTLFAHAFYETVVSKDDTFSWTRAERIDWIGVALADPAADLFRGWDNKRKMEVADRRVAVVQKNYVVVIHNVKSGRAEFLTAYVASAETIRKIRSHTRWK